MENIIINVSTLLVIFTEKDQSDLNGTDVYSTASVVKGNEQSSGSPFTNIY